MDQQWLALPGPTWSAAVCSTGVSPALQAVQKRAARLTLTESCWGSGGQPLGKSHQLICQPQAKGGGVCGTCGIGPSVNLHSACLAQQRARHQAGCGRDTGQLPLAELYKSQAE